MGGGGKVRIGSFTAAKVILPLKYCIFILLFLCKKKSLHQKS
jgi:hypothetical protein